MAANDRADLGRVGIWTRQLDSQPAAVAQGTAAELEALGYPTLWIPEAVEREVLTHATLLLAATSRITVATGIANVHARAPRTAALAQLMLTERFPGRFVLGLGVSHPVMVERVLHQAYGSPLSVMRDCLDGMDAVLAAPHAAPPASPPERLLGALGPKMLDLAAERSLGAHTYVAPVEHTAWARARVGPGVLIAPAVKVVLDADGARARAIGRWSVAPTIRNPAYHDNLVRFGFADDDFGSEPSDRLVDALVAWGDPGAIAERIHEHLDAGADHVAVEVLTGDDSTVPSEAWRELAPVLTELGART
jgi:probable F420-dependent oxidoreductase